MAYEIWTSGTSFLPGQRYALAWIYGPYLLKEAEWLRRGCFQGDSALELEHMIPDIRRRRQNQLGCIRGKGGLQASSREHESPCTCVLFSVQ